jgi:hypothetical protein
MCELLTCRRNKAEAVDLAICGLALFFGRGGDLSELVMLLHKKLDKWEGKYRST